MRYNINLATRPYVDAAKFYRNWMLLLVPLVVVAAVLTGLAVSAVLGSRDAAKKVRQDEAQIAKLDQARARAEEVMNRPENKDTRDKSRFLNSVIERKAFSWTRVFEELERIVPQRVHVLSIRPEIANGQVQINMLFAGESHESGIELLRHLESSESFRNPQLRAENAKEGGGNGPAEVEFDVSATYVPHLEAAPPQPAPAGGGR